MADLPPDAQSYRIAAVVPCMDTRVSVRGWPCWENERDRCWNCLGDGTRAIVTDVEVERFGMAWNHRPMPMSLPWSWHSEGSPIGPNETHVWREVPR